MWLKNCTLVSVMKFYSSLLVVLTLAAAHAFGSPDILGVDDRQDLPSKTLKKDLVQTDLERHLDEVVFIEIEYPDETLSVCSGALVSANIVLTARHCVFDDANQKFKEISSIVVSANYNKTKKNSANGTYIKISQDSGYSSGDFAVIVLDRDLGIEFGFLNFKQIDFSAPQDIFLAAYHGDKNGILSYQACKSLPYLNYLSDDGKIRYVESSATMRHGCDSQGGSSGGPIIQCKDSACYIVGVHIAGSQHDNNKKIVQLEDPRCSEGKWACGNTATVSADIVTLINETVKEQAQ